MNQDRHLWEEVLAHPRIAEIIEELSLTQSEQEANARHLHDIYDYHQGHITRLKYLYRGLAGTIFWAWSATDVSEENIWCSEITPMDMHLDLRSLEWDQVASQRLLELVRDLTHEWSVNTGQVTSENIYLYGPTHTHKTLVIKALLNYARTHYTVALLNIVDLQERISDMESGDIRNLITRLRSVQILAIDDIGAEMVTDQFRDGILYRVIAARRRQGLPTFYTSTFTPTQLERLQRGNRPTLYSILKARKLLEQIVGNCVIIDTKAA